MTDDQASMMPTIPPPPYGLSPARALRLAAGILLIAYSFVMLTVVRFPYITLSPGSATDVHGLIDVEGADTFDAEGRLLFLTVSLSQRITVLEAIAAWSESGVEVLKEEVFIGKEDREDVTRRNLLEMQRSEIKAMAVALDRLGIPVERLGGGAVVTSVEPGLPAEGRVEAGDIIVAVDGEPTVFRAEAIEAVRARDPGDVVRLTLKRGDEQVDVDLTTARGTEGQPLVGLNLDDTFEFQFPFEIDINTGEVGGPSAGLAFTLAIIDELTAGELTGGEIVAVTGAIELDGTVTQVGGVEQKAAAARRAGAVLMIVPKGEAAAARPVAGDMRIAEVSTLDDALDALARLGGNADALPPPTPARAPSPTPAPAP